MINFLIIIVRSLHSLNITIYFQNCAILIFKMIRKIFRTVSLYESVM